MKLKNAITSRIKIMAELDIAERRLPQDGRIKLKLGRRQGDGLPRLRPADAVRREGRAAAPRQVQPAARHDQAGLRGSGRSKTSRRRSTSRTAWSWSPGPPVRGKTTTLYSALSELNKTTENISTAEDPVEFNLAGHQPGADARGDRAQLRRGPALLPAPGPGHHHGRRDPRLRDGGNRRSRPRSPATWCSPRCTPTTPRRPINRLLNMGIEPFLVASAVNLIMAQRLARRVCADCKEPEEVPNPRC